MSGKRVRISFLVVFPVVIAIALAVVWTSANGATVSTPADTTARSAPKQPLNLRPPTPAELDVLHDAVEFRIRDCMAAQGVRYIPGPRSPGFGYRSFPYVIDDVGWAKAHGFGRDIEAKLDQDAKNGTAGRYYHSLSREQLDAYGQALTRGRLTGLSATSPLGGTVTHSDGGCEAEVWQQIYGSAAQWFQASTIVTNLDNIRHSMVQSDNKFAVAVHAWSKCMLGNGIAVADPATLQQTQLAKTGVTAQSQDIAVATFEAQCAVTSGLSRSVQELDHSYGDQLHTKYRSTYDTLYRLQLTALPLARSVARSK